MVVRPNQPLIIALRASLIARAKHLGSKGSSLNRSRLRRRLLETFINIRMDILVSNIHLNYGMDSALAKFCSWDRSAGRAAVISEIEIALSSRDPHTERSYRFSPHPIFAYATNALALFLPTVPVPRDAGRCALPNDKVITPTRASYPTPACI